MLKATLLNKLKDFYVDRLLLLHSVGEDLYNDLYNLHSQYDHQLAPDLPHVQSSVKHGHNE